VLTFRTPRLAALHAALFAPGPRFRRRPRRRQPAPGGGIVVSPRWSPGSPEQRHACRPREPHLAPLSGCLRKAPLDEQGEGSMDIVLGRVKPYLKYVSYSAKPMLPYWLDRYFSKSKSPSF